MTIQIPFNVPYLTGLEVEFIRDALDTKCLTGNGFYTQKATTCLSELYSSSSVFLTNSCTTALEMCAQILDLKSGDEIIVPSYTFVSTANAFVASGATPVFVDIDKSSLNIDPDIVEAAITHRTKAVVAVHYAGNACSMSRLTHICSKYGLYLIEDAAQAVLSFDPSGKALGTFGHLSCLSFHETKNITCGEGGALIVNDKTLVERAHIVYEKGTNRTLFLAGQVDKYTWREKGSSYAMSEVVAAFLYAQLLESRNIIEKRRDRWQRYDSLLAKIPSSIYSLPPSILGSVTQNAHMYYLLASTPVLRSHILQELNRRGVMAVFHYIPLHSSPAGIKYGRSFGVFPNTDSISARLIRLPLWVGVDCDYVVSCLKEVVLAV